MTSSIKVVKIIMESKACNAACGTGPKGFMYVGPKAHKLSGISTRKRVVMASEMWDRISSHSGASSPGGVHVGERKLYARSARTQIASMVIYL